MQNNISARVLSLKAVSLWVVLKWYILPRQRHLQLREGKRRHVTNWRNKRWPGVVFVLRANCAQNQTSFQRFQTLISMLSNSCQQVSLCIFVGKNQTSQMLLNFSTCYLTAAPLFSLSLNIRMAPKFRLFLVLLILVSTLDMKCITLVQFQGRRRRGRGRWWQGPCPPCSSHPRNSPVGRNWRTQI